jgi:hypothetical protein
MALPGAFVLKMIDLQQLKNHNNQSDTGVFLQNESAD